LITLHRTSAKASTVLAATDGTANFFFDELSDAQLGLFDDDLEIAGTALEVPVPSTVSIAPDGAGDFTVTNENSDQLPLTNQPWFVLGVSTDGGSSWIADSGVAALGADAFRVFFQLGGAGAGSVVAVDVQIAPMVVPAPAALWLFACGLIGLLGTARRTAHSRALVETDCLSRFSAR
jgi:hypothetical protein